MDAIPDWAAQYLGDPYALQTYGPYLRQFYSMTSTVRSYLTPIIRQATNNPDLTSVALLLVIIFISLKLLNMLWQTFVFWLRLARKVVVWGGLIALAAWMYTRGPDGVREDVVYWMEVWSQEKNHWKEKERAARRAKMGGVGGAGRGGGWF